MRKMVIAVLVAGATMAQTPNGERLNERQVQELGAMGAKAFGIKWQGELKGGVMRGVSAVTDGATTMTTRAGGRMYIVHNPRLMEETGKAGFEGTDDQLKQRGLAILRATGADVKQVADVKVLQQYTQLGEVDQERKAMRMQEVQKSVRTLQITRRVGKVEVPSSRLALHLARGGEIAFMELNWPDIQPAVLQRARRLQVAGGRIKVPQVDAAKVESKEPVVLHSPAVGFYNDEVAALRVIYAPTNERVGKKPVRYLDVNGRDVVQPRSMDLPKEEKVERKGSSASQ